MYLSCPTWITLYREDGGSNFSETFVNFYQTTRLYISEAIILLLYTTITLKQALSSADGKCKIFVYLSTTPWKWRWVVSPATLHRTFWIESWISLLEVSEKRKISYFYRCSEELSVYFIDWEKAFDRVNWIKLMQILKEAGIDWRKRRLISNLYMP
jgi:hypothetical protein